MMKSSEYGRITDELLSAYIDNAVTEQERNLVEAAVAADAEVAWRLDTLQQTVYLLRSLPELALPRSFTIQESQIGDLVPAERGAEQVSRRSWPARIADSWRGFWLAGSPVYRNLATASLVLLLIMAGGSIVANFSLSGAAAPAAEEVAFSEPVTTQPSAELAAAAEAPAETQVTEAAEPIPTIEPVAASEAPEARSAEPLVDEAELAAAAEEPPAEELPAEAAAAPPPKVAAEAQAQPPAPESFALEAAPAEAAEPAASAAEPAFASAAAEPQVAPPEAAEAEIAPAEETATEEAALLTEPMTAGAAEAELSVSEQPQEPATEPSPTASKTEETEVAALPAATATPAPTVTPLSAAESPQATPYPAPEQGQTPGLGAISLFQVLTLALLAATIIFGGLWWRSRSAAPSPD